MATQNLVDTQRAQRVPLLCTKLDIPPPRPELVPRPRAAAIIGSSSKTALPLKHAVNASLRINAPPPTTILETERASCSKSDAAEFSSRGWQAKSH